MLSLLSVVIFHFRSRVWPFDERYFVFGVIIIQAWALCIWSNYISFISFSIISFRRLLVYTISVTEDCVERAPSKTVWQCVSMCLFWQHTVSVQCCCVRISFWSCRFLQGTSCGSIWKAVSQLFSNSIVLSVDACNCTISPLLSPLLSSLYPCAYIPSSLLLSSLCVSSKLAAFPGNRKINPGRYHIVDYQWLESEFFFVCYLLCCQVVAVWSLSNESSWFFGLNSE